MKVDIEYIQWLSSELRKIEGIPLSELELYIGDDKIDIDDETSNQWSFTGLMNRDFILSEEYKDCPSYKRYERDNKLNKIL
jgi:hypothetical protein